MKQTLETKIKEVLKEFHGDIQHVHPACISSRFCYPHDEIGIVKHDVVALEKFISSSIRKVVEESLKEVELDEDEVTDLDFDTDLMGSVFANRVCGYNTAVDNQKAKHKEYLGK